MTTVTISLTGSLKDFAEAQARAKGLSGIEDYLGSLLRDAQARENDARIDALLLEGLAGESIPLDEAFLTRLEEKTGQIAARFASRVTPA